MTAVDEPSWNREGAGGGGKTEFLALDPIDAMMKAAKYRVPGPWWRLASDTHDFVVKAPTERIARAIVAEACPDGREILFVYLMP